MPGPMQRPLPTEGEGRWLLNTQVIPEDRPWKKGIEITYSNNLHKLCHKSGTDIKQNL